VAYPGILFVEGGGEKKKKEDMERFFSTNSVRGQRTDRNGIWGAATL
jgi:hypothetical protein